MMLDLLITHATLADCRTGMSVPVQGARIAEFAPGLQAPAYAAQEALRLLLSAVRT